MPTYNNPIEFTILAGGLNQPIDVEESNNLYKIIGTATITVDNIFVHSGTLYDGLTYEYDYKAVATYSGAEVKFHGVAMTATQALKNHRIIATYDGTKWEVDFIPDLAEDGIIETSKLADEAVTFNKTADLARGSIVTGQANDRPAALDAKTDAQILIGDGTDLNSVAITGDITLNNAGLTGITAGAIVNADVNASAAIAVSKLAAGAATGQILVTSGASVPTWTAMTGDATISSTGVVSITNNGILKTISVTIPTASVLTLNGTPITIIPAQGAGTYIEVISATAQMTYVSATYAGNGILRLLTTGATIGQVSWTANGFLFGTATRMVKGTMTATTGASETQLLANTAVVAQVDTGNPTTGDSDIVIEVCYRVIS